MLRTNKLKAALNDGRTVFGLLNSMPLPLIVEMIGYAGYDFVIIDMEHVGVNPETLENMIRAAECADITPLVRVPEINPKTILRVLDCGAQGVVAPQVRSRADAERLVAASRYYPQGERGISGGRTTGFGTTDLISYFALANREIIVVAMIEDRCGVDNIEEIVSVQGIDMILEGAIDLSQSLSVPGQPQHPIVQDALMHIAGICRKHDKPFCAMPRVPGQFETWSTYGVKAFLVGDDRGIGFRAMKANRIAYN